VCLGPTVAWAFLCPPVRGISAHVSGYPDTHRNRYGMKASTDPHFQ
jgi:hypothetical protein